MEGMMELWAVGLILLALVWIGGVLTRLMILIVKISQRTDQDQKPRTDKRDKDT